MQRVTITLDDELIAALDHTVTACGYQNRSEALRDLAKAELLRFKRPLMLHGPPWPPSPMFMIIGGGSWRSD